MSSIIISTESGADLPYKITVPHNIQVIPMHISFGEKTLSEGSFENEKIFEYYNSHKKLPKTSAPNPGDYTLHFKSIFRRHPNCRIIHISYSSKLSVSYQNALLASHEFDSSRICIIDSLNASSGLGMLVMHAAEIRNKYQNIFSFEECVTLIKQARERICCSFVPQSLEFLRAGGRITGAAQIGAAVLNLKPSVVVKDGLLVSGKKYRGKIQHIAFNFMSEFVEQNKLKKDCIIIGYSYGVSKSMLFALKRYAHKLGFKKSWCFRMSSAVSSHAGPGCIGYAGIKEN